MTILGVAGYAHDGAKVAELQSSDRTFLMVSCQGIQLCRKTSGIQSATVGGIELPGDPELTYLILSCPLAKPRRKESVQPLSLILKPSFRGKRPNSQRRKQKCAILSLLVASND